MRTLEAKIGTNFRVGLKLRKDNSPFPLAGSAVFFSIVEEDGVTPIVSNVAVDMEDTAHNLNIGYVVAKFTKDLWPDDIFKQNVQFQVKVTLNGEDYFFVTTGRITEVEPALR